MINNGHSAQFSAILLKLMDQKIEKKTKTKQKQLMYKLSGKEMSEYIRKHTLTKML